ncbi:hypothetical protein N0V82_007729 [Gnomoniopsis sp. IMI 355080]|nr:hypothetical protein N0V82_007729 [Gnomoniopsis sp. IMI 355080]
MVRARVKPSPGCFSLSLTSKPRLSHSSPSRFGPPKPSKHSGTKEPQAGVSEASLRVSPTAHSAQQVDSATAVNQAKYQLFAKGGVPTENDVLAALLHIDNAATSGLGNSTRQLTRKSIESDTAATSLLSLDGSVADPEQPLDAQASDTSRPGNLVHQISQVAFEVVSHPAVVITPPILEAYIVIQARLGRAETLPHVLSLYASKPKPRLNAGSIEYVSQNPDDAAKALDSDVVEQALDAAIEAKNLDAAIGVIENTYATKAFARQKLLKKALIPASLAATAPVAVYLAASRLAQLQSSFDQSTATAVAAAGMLAYVGFTGSIGLLSILTSNDQMKRVTWAPGVTLRQRWLREEQRAALDKVACAFGYSQAHRFGEEKGEEFQALRQFVLQQGMILDRVELMQGMS